MSSEGDEASDGAGDGAGVEEAMDIDALKAKVDAEIFNVDNNEWLGDGDDDSFTGEKFDSSQASVLAKIIGHDNDYGDKIPSLNGDAVSGDEDEEDDIISASRKKRHLLLDDDEEDALVYPDDSEDEPLPSPKKDKKRMKSKHNFDDESENEDDHLNQLDERSTAKPLPSPQKDKKRMKSKHNFDDESENEDDHLNQLDERSTAEPKENDQEKSPSDDEKFDDDDEEFLASAALTTATASKDTNDNMSTGEPDDNIIDIGALKAKYDAQIFNDNPEGDGPNENGEGNDDGSSDDDDEAPKVIEKIVAVEPKVQRAFQPGSTPASLEQRFMVWNDVGIVRCYNNDDENTIDVEFHDSAVYHSIHLTNTYNYTMADLSSEALVLANRKIDGTLSSRLFCMYFRTWDANKEWKFDMPEDEYIDCITIGSGFVAVATDQRFVRLFTVGGIQLNIFSIPGSPVTMAAQEKSLMAIFHNACPLPGDQSVSMYCFKVDSHCALIKKQPMPDAIPVALSPKSLLTWAGFTDEGTPCTVDLRGIVRLYNKVMGNAWMPMVDLRTSIENKADHSWVIGLSEIQQQVRCIFCKGSRFPATVPRPMVGTTSFELPLCEKTNTRGKFEEKHLRSKICNNVLEKLLVEGYEVEQQQQANAKDINESLLRIFAMAIGSNCEALALEVSYLMPNKKAIDAAIRYALSKRCTALAEKLGDVAREKEEQQEEEFEEELPVARQSPNRNSVVRIQAETVESSLKPKALKLHAINDDESSDEEVTFVSATNNKNRVKESDDEDSNAQVLRPKAVKLPVKQSLNPFKIAAGAAAKKRSRRECEDEENESQSLSGFELYFKEMNSVFRGDNPDIGDDDLREVVRDGYDSLGVAERKQWTADAKKKLGKVTKKIRT